MSERVRWWGPLDDAKPIPAVVPPAAPVAPATALPDPALARIEMVLNSVLSACTSMLAMIQKLRATMDPAEVAALITDMQQTTDALAKSIALINPPTTGA